MQRVSTRNVPARERLAFVHDFVARNWAGMRFQPLDKRDLQIDIALQELPEGVAVATAKYPPMIGSRSRDLLSDGRDNYTLAIVSDDHEVSVEGRASFTVKAGDLFLVNEGTCFEVRHPRAMKVDVVSLSRSHVAERASGIDLAPFYHVRRAVPGVSMFTGYTNLLRQAPPADEKARQLAASHVHDLISVVLDGVVQGGVQHDASSIRTARLQLVRKDIADRLNDATLCIDAVARRQRVTPRYIQQLFEATGMTFTQFLREQRLALAYERLNNAYAQGSIAQLAYECGFSDLSTFNRAFRRYFGATPSEVRADALRRRAAIQ